MSEIDCPNKRHKKHRSDRRDREGSVDKPQGLKLILKVGSQNTPEHNEEWTYQGPGYNPETGELMRMHHKKSKKKKKKKDKNKDRERKHKHHHKDKKRKREENGDFEEEKEDKDGTQSEVVT